MFGITLVIVYKKVDFVFIQGIQPSFIFLIFQILYAIRLREHLKSKIRKLCSQSVAPSESEENHDLNSIGIYVGGGKNAGSISNVSQSATSSTNFRANTFVHQKNLNTSDSKYDLFGGVYIGPFDIEDNGRDLDIDDKVQYKICDSDSTNSLSIFTVSKTY